MQLISPQRERTYQNSHVYQVSHDLVNVQTLLNASPQGATVFIARFPPTRIKQAPLHSRGKVKHTRLALARCTRRVMVFFFFS